MPSPLTVRTLIAGRAIADKYIEEGGRRVLGQPLAPASMGGVVMQNFQGGTIHWNDHQGTLTQEVLQVAVFFQGLYCFHRQSGPGSDEPYVIVSVYQKTTPEKSKTEQFGPFEG